MSPRPSPRPLPRQPPSPSPPPRPRRTQRHLPGAAGAAGGVCVCVWGRIWGGFIPPAKGFFWGKTGKNKIAVGFYPPKIALSPRSEGRDHAGFVLRRVTFNDKRGPKIPHPPTPPRFPKYPKISSLSQLQHPPHTRPPPGGQTDVGRQQPRGCAGRGTPRVTPATAVVTSPLGTTGCPGL